MRNYHALKDYLQMQKQQIVTISFEEITQIIGDTLPASALRHNAWWSSSGHSHAVTWEESGYKAINVSQNVIRGQMQFRNTLYGTEEKPESPETPTRLRQPLEQHVPEQSFAFQLRNSETVLDFYRQEITFCGANLSNVFGNMNSRTLEKIIRHEKYRTLAATVRTHYTKYLNMKIGEFLLLLKNRGDDFYKGFLNAYGDQEYCKFHLAPSAQIYRKGIYLLTLDDYPIYIGRCRDSFYKRFENGYGSISPRNCYKDGQSTNVRINALISRNRHNLDLYFSPLDSITQIERVEKSLISYYSPKWNIQG